MGRNEQNFWAWWKYIKDVIHGIILKLNAPVEDDIAMLTVSWTLSVSMYGAYVRVQMHVLYLCGSLGGNLSTDRV